MYATLGSAVTVVEMTAGLLPGADRDLVDVLAKRVATDDEAVLARHARRVAEAGAEGHSRRVRGHAREGARGETPKEQVFDRVLVSVGRRPNSAIPGLDRTRVQVDQRGFIMVDEQRRTARAVDLRDRRRRRRADARAQGVARRPCRRGSDRGRERRVRRRGRFRRSSSPIPKLAWCGLTEAQAQKDNRNVVDREVSVGRIRPRDHAGPDRRPHEARRRSRDRAGARRRPRRSRRRRADRRRRARDRNGRERHRPRSCRFTRTRRSPRR